ncbi:MAG: LOG family protein [Anaerolineales bacterium]
MLVSVFGSSHPLEGSPLYEEGRRLGGLLGQRGWQVATGGYNGLMAAVSQGVAEAGGQVLGVTCQLYAQAGLRANRWVQKEICLPTLEERLHFLVSRCDAAVALSGGIGTLSEVALTWSLVQAGAVPPRPLLLVGPSWKRILEAFFQESADLIRPEERLLLTLCQTPEAALGHLEGYAARAGRST